MKKILDTTGNFSSTGNTLAGDEGNHQNDEEVDTGLSFKEGDKFKVNKNEYPNAWHPIENTVYTIARIWSIYVMIEVDGNYITKYKIHEVQQFFDTNKWIKL